MSEPTCLVCLIPYNAEDHRPLLLPACGHTFCAVCLGCLYGQGNTSCPKCRKDGAVQPVSSLPVNYSLLEIAEDSACEASDDAEPNSASSRAAGASKSQGPTPNPNSFSFNTFANPFGIAGASRPQEPTPNSNAFCFHTNPFGIGRVPRPQAPTPHTYPGLEALGLLPIQSVPLVLQGGSSQLAPQEASNSTSLPRPTGSPPSIERFFTRHDSHRNSARFPSPIYQNQARKCQFLQNLQGSHPSISRPLSQELARAAVKKSLVKASHRNNTTSPPPGRTQDDQNSASAIFTALEKEQQDELDFQLAIHLTFCKDSSHDHDLHNRCSAWRMQNR